MKFHQHHLKALIAYLLIAGAMFATANNLPLKGKNIGDVRVDLPEYPLSFQLLDKDGVIRFQVLSSGQLVVSAAEGVRKASTTIIIASIGKDEWQLHTYKSFSKPVLRLLPETSNSRAVLRVWTDKDAFFDIDLGFSGKLKFQTMKIAEQGASLDG